MRVCVRTAQVLSLMDEARRTNRASKSWLLSERDVRHSQLLDLRLADG